MMFECNFSVVFFLKQIKRMGIKLGIKGLNEYSNDH